MSISDALVQQCYQAFIQKGIINPTYISKDECRTALIGGCSYHQGKGQVDRFMRKTLKKMNNPRSQKTHIGTLARLDALTTQKVEAARIAHEQEVVAAATREKAMLTQQLNQTKSSLQQHQQQLAVVNQSIAILNQHRDENQRQINNLNSQLIRLQENLNLSSIENQEFVTQITELQRLLIQNQQQIMQKFVAFGYV